MFLAYIILSDYVYGREDSLYFMEALARMGLLQTGEYAVLIIYTKESLNIFDGTSKTGQIFIQSMFDLSSTKQPMILFTLLDRYELPSRPFVRTSNHGCVSKLQIRRDL